MLLNYTPVEHTILLAPVTQQPLLLGGPAMIYADAPLQNLRKSVIDDKEKYSRPGDEKRFAAIMAGVAQEFGAPKINVLALSSCIATAGIEVYDFMASWWWFAMAISYTTFTELGFLARFLATFIGGIEAFVHITVPSCKAVLPAAMPTESMLKLKSLTMT